MFKCSNTLSDDDFAYNSTRCSEGTCTRFESTSIGESTIESIKSEEMMKGITILDSVPSNQEIY